ncbi:MAG TPA: peptidase U32 family protein [Bacteroidales bacterium]|nr:peptidase U32 family protein [Bacteroidales bacterium]
MTSGFSELKLQNLEIMAPAGSYESLIAAIQGGANSVYFGVGKLNMRSRSSQNFSLDDLRSIASVCSQHGVKSYLTLNTVIFDDDMDEVRRTVEVAAETGISAIIASDMSVISFARNTGMEVHLSTQTNITNIEAVRFFSQFADVIVTARELTLQQVSDIVKAIEQQQVKGPSGRLLQIEVFVHGALCMAISGKCYLSLDNMNASANRGACLQPCRRTYLVTDKEDGHQYELDHQYIMSPKDLCTIGFLDKIVQAGVAVLKIEGRGRSPEYVKTVTRCYREAADAVVNNTFDQIKVEHWMEQLKSVYNRGFWDGYYLGRKMGEWTGRYGSQATRRKVYIGLVTNYFSRLNVAEVKIETNELLINDPLLIIGPTTGVLELNASEIRVGLQPVANSKKGELCSIPVPGLVRRGDKVYKWVEADSPN